MTSIADGNTCDIATFKRWQVIVAGICALILTVGLARFAYTPLLPIMRDKAGLSYLAGGWLATINYAGYMTGTLVAASISDLHRKFTFYRVGLVVALLSTAAMGLTTNVFMWGILRFIAGVSSIAGMLLASGLVLNWLLRHGYQPELGLHFMGLGLGIAVSGVAVGGLGIWLEWNEQWAMLGLLGNLFLLPAWAWLPKPAAIPATSTNQPRTSAPPGRRWMRLLLASYSCAGFGFAISATFIVAILVKIPLLAGWGSWAWVIVGLAAAPSCFLWDRVANSTGPLRALMVAFGLQTLSIILPLITDDAFLNICGALVFGETFVGIVSLTLTLIGRHYPDNPSKAMAKMTLGYGVAQIVAPAMAGYIAARTGSYHGALIVTAVIMVGGVVLLQALVREERMALR